MVVAAEVINDAHLPDREPGGEQQPERVRDVSGGGSVHHQFALVRGVVKAPVAEPEQSQAGQADRAALVPGDPGHPRSHRRRQNRRAGLKHRPGR
ncbi:MAG TPA: hypothetical protein VF933_09885 [Streptosporangiaceae bacterium]